MTKKVAATPKGYRTATPELVVRGADAAIAFYQDVFEATVLSRVVADDEFTVLQAELKIGNSIVRLSDEMPAFGIFSPLGYGGTPVGLHIYHEATDEIWDRALAQGAGILVPLADTPWGEHYGKIVDPFGHVWSISRRIAKAKVKPAKKAEKPVVEAVTEAPVADETVVTPTFSVHEPQADIADVSAEKEMALQTTEEMATTNVA